MSIGLGLLLSALGASKGGIAKKSLDAYVPEANKGEQAAQNEMELDFYELSPEEFAAKYMGAKPGDRGYETMIAGLSDARNSKPS